MIRASFVLVVVCYALTPLLVNAAEFVVLEEAGISVSDVSADGQVVVGSVLQMVDLQATSSSWRWTKSGGKEELGLPDGEYASSSANIVSADGTVIGGTVFRRSTIPPTPTAEPWRWSVEDHWEPLELPDGTDWGGAWNGISADGSTIGGSAGGAALWTDGLIDQSFREAFVGSVSSGTVGISADGNTVVGSVTWNEGDSSELYVWTSQDGMTTVGGIEGSDTRPTAISSDGSVIVGQTPDFQAWKWTQSSSFVDLSIRGLATFPRDVNRDGSVAIGFSRSSGRDSLETALVWDAHNEPHDLRSLLEDEHGLEDLPSRLSRATGISDDGRVIVGYNTPPGSGQPSGAGWIIQLDRPVVVATGVLGDFNGNAELDAGDLDLLAVELQSDRDVSLFDVNVDDVVNFADREFWVGDLASTFMGDADLDQDVDFADFLSLSAGFGEEGGWAQGDFDGDGTVTFEDFLLLSGSFGESRAMPAAASSVPEPKCHFIHVIACTLLFQRRRRRSA